MNLLYFAALLAVVRCSETIPVTYTELGDKLESSSLLENAGHYFPFPYSEADSLAIDLEGLLYPHTSDIIEMCSRNSTTTQKFAHPVSCAWYIDCSLTPDAVMLTFFNSYVQECPYPQLFSELTSQCEDFSDVKCKDRFEPKSPCEYRANQCQESSHCVPCWVRYASCIGSSEGLNPVAGMAWEPSFVECHKERTVFQGSCTSGTVFSPITRACETPLNIPTHQGGWKPSCQGRRDGLYPDHRGRCDTFFLCRGQLFRGHHRCMTERDSEREKRDNLVFNPFTSSCEPADKVPYPCGNYDDGIIEVDENNLMAEQDANYTDISLSAEIIGNGSEIGSVGNKSDAFNTSDLFDQQNSNSRKGHMLNESVNNNNNVSNETVMSHNTCRQKPDGKYMDIFGRCSHYFTCKNGSNNHFQVCPDGIFDVVKGECSDDITNNARLPRPCGQSENPCLYLPDGTHVHMGNSSACPMTLVCERGLVIAVQSACE